MPVAGRTGQETRGKAHPSVVVRGLMGVDVSDGGVTMQVRVNQVRRHKGH